jgi:hypothetical protein
MRFFNGGANGGLCCRFKHGLAPCISIPELMPLWHAAILPTNETFFSFGLVLLV